MSRPKYRFAAAFGLPPSLFRWLAAGVLLYFVYSATAAILNPARWIRAIRVIAVANALYSVVTLTMVVVLRDRITPLGTVYFVGEALIILGIAAAEWRYTTLGQPGDGASAPSLPSRSNSSRRL